MLIFYTQLNKQMSLTQIKNEVEKIYSLSEDKSVKWFYTHHVLVVAKYAEEIATELNRSQRRLVYEEISVIATFFHDFAPSWDVGEEPSLTEQSIKKSAEIMKKHG